MSCVFQASQGDVGQAVGLLTTQPPEEPGDPQESAETWEGQKGEAIIWGTVVQWLAH